jgi:general secretion pathway protein G
MYFIRGQEPRSVATGATEVALVRQAAGGFTLIEMVITVAILSILTLAAIPLVRVAVKRQKEQQLREVLRTMRAAIDEFHRDTQGMNCSGGASQIVNPTAPVIDPRSRVMISDCTIFGVDNLDRYPPDLDTLKTGVNVIPRTPNATGGQGLSGTTGTATTLAQSSTKTKRYLREIPINPITGERDWEFRSCYDDPTSDSWGGENVFDVRFPKGKDDKFKSLNGEKYSDW